MVSLAYLIPDRCSGTPHPLFTRNTGLATVTHIAPLTRLHGATYRPKGLQPGRPQPADMVPRSLEDFNGALAGHLARTGAGRPVTRD